MLPKQCQSYDAGNDAPHCLEQAVRITGLLEEGE